MRAIRVFLIGLFISVSLASATSSALPNLQTLAPALKNPDTSLLDIYSAALKNLDTQFVLSNDGTVYVSTGDIHAEWLRDSSVQTRAYLLFAAANADAAALVKGVVLRQARSIAIDPYANAFYENYSVHERKYELDSLVNPILLAWTYWKITKDASIFAPEVWAGFKVALSTLQTEQDHERRSTYSDPRLSGNPSVRNGMIWSGFRPSDDRCQFNYNIPANAMAAQGLHALAEVASVVFNDTVTETAASKLESEVREAIQKYGIARTKDGEVVFAYEVDGLGHALVADDANLPSLLSLPYYGFVSANDPLYVTTRNRLLSAKNPYYFSGTLLRGIGSPHTPKNMVWPLGLISEALTSTTVAGFDSALKNLVDSNFGGSGLHESVNVDDSSKFTRADFGWPNAMFVEMALTRWNGLPELPRVTSSAQ
jgi:meiotically up-regulated gene 157 (Mug157) protein